MSRIRSQHPGQWTDDQFVTCSPLARLLALAIRNFADDNGIFEWNPVKLKMLCLPADNCDVAELLSELERSKQVHRYEHDGRKLGIIRNFTKFQSPKKPNFTFSAPIEFPSGYALHKDYKPSGSVPVPHQSGKPSPEVIGGEGRVDPPSPLVGNSGSLPDKVNGHSDSDKPDEIVDAFYAIRQHIFGNNPPERPSPKELSIAKGWLEDGATFYPLRDLFERRMQWMADRAQGAPPLTYFTPIVPEALAQGWPGYSP